MKCPTCGHETGGPIRIPLYCELSEVEVVNAHAEPNSGSPEQGIAFARLLHSRSTSGFYKGLFSEMKYIAGRTK